MNGPESHGEPRICGQRTRGLYGAETVCVRPPDHKMPHTVNDGIWLSDHGDDCDCPDCNGEPRTPPGEDEGTKTAEVEHLRAENERLRRENMAEALDPGGAIRMAKAYNEGRASHDAEVERLRAENERLRRDYKGYREYAEELGKNVSDLKAENEQLRATIQRLRDAGGKLSVYDEIAAERQRAHAKHGDTSMENLPATDMTRLSVLMEEVGEVAREYNEARHRTHRNLLPQGERETAVDLAALRKELIQVAAMAAAWADVLNVAAVTAVEGTERQESNPYPPSCLLRDCLFTAAGICTLHGSVCPPCYCGTGLHEEPDDTPPTAVEGTEK
jgi:NTP pyrophosphatase (non-canonical NTP hydrolase)